MTTPSPYEANHTYTDQQLLDLWRECHARISVSGQSYSLADGREYTAADAGKVLGFINYYQQRVNAASGSNPSQILARFPGR
jgi:hypothetical protein